MLLFVDFCGIIIKGNVMEGERIMDICEMDNHDDVLRLPDIQLGVSLGAKWKNYDIKMPDGEILNLTVKTPIGGGYIIDED